uniref:Uncharacterized protein n=1 Tax=Coptotermes formosanus TaxID=36987 RepID=R4UVQ7_COPFO|nr:hypothetical protein [Coptotermes formosanus]
MCFCIWNFELGFLGHLFIRHVDLMQSHCPVSPLFLTPCQSTVKCSRYVNVNRCCFRLPCLIVKCFH